jgi:Holliday junction resolvase RusA-like endonuclease
MIIKCTPIIEFNVESKIMGSVRKTRSDKWKKRKCVLDEYTFRDEIKKKCELLKLTDNIYLDVFIKMPDSYSDKKKRSLYDKPHNQKPDWDNIAKCIQDTLAKDDKTIYFGVVRKRWAFVNKIIIGNIEVINEN